MVDSELATRTDTAFVTLDGVSRNFGETRAVRDVTLDLAISGRIHALVGENGAGKSTCLGIAAGRIPPSSGRVIVAGEELTSASPRVTKGLGLAAIYQELTVVPALSPEANVYLGQTISSGGWLREKEMRAGYEELCARFGVAAVSARRAGSLSVAEQQTLEILRALASEARCVLFDEPTASLAQSERDALFSTMHELRGQGLALTIVSHNLDEILEHSDVITVFRDGSVVETRPRSGWTKHEMVDAMLGDHNRGADIASGHHQTRRVRPAGTADAAPALVVKNLSSPGIIEGVDFVLRPGEVLGISGLVGSGRTSILRAIAGLDSKATGEVQTAKSSVTRVPRSAREARRRGIALLPEDRKGQGLLLGRSGRDNVTLGDWGSLSNGGFISERRLAKAATSAAEQVAFNTARLGEDARRLSGGNQQKLMIARWMHSTHPVLLADEPTRGVDVGAKSEILVALEKIVSQGRSMIVVSSELEEVIGLSDRVLVIDQGRVLALLDGAVEEITPAKVLKIIFDAAEPAASSDSTSAKE